MTELWQDLVGDSGFWASWGGEIVASVLVLIIALVILSISKRSLARWASRVRRSKAGIFVGWLSWPTS